MQMLTIHIDLGELLPEVALNLRYTLVSTLEERGIGEVFDEGMGNYFMDVSLDLVPSDEKELEIKSILEALGVWHKCKLIYKPIEG